MKSVKYYVCSCLECKHIVMFKVDFTDFNDNCCLEYNNLKVLKVFNDENEAKNYKKLVSAEEA